jgi:hypothetical protein
LLVHKKKADDALAELAALYNVPIGRNSLGEPQIRGKFGHVYVDGGRVWVCYTDCDDGSDGRRTRPLTVRQKAAALKRLRPWVRRVQLDCEVEFIVEIDPAAVETVLDMLRVLRHRSTYGMSRPFGPVRTPVKLGV